MPKIGRLGGVETLGFSARRKPGGQALPGENRRADGTECGMQTRFGGCLRKTNPQVIHSVCGERTNVQLPFFTKAQARTGFPLKLAICHKNPAKRGSILQDWAKSSDNFPTNSSRKRALPPPEVSSYPQFIHRVKSMAQRVSRGAKHAPEKAFRGVERYTFLRRDGGKSGRAHSGRFVGIPGRRGYFSGVSPVFSTSSRQRPSPPGRL